MLVKNKTYLIVLAAVAVIAIFFSQTTIVKSLPPSITSMQKLVTPDGAAGDLFGYSVAISGDYGLIGAPYKDNQGVDSGTAYLFNLKTKRLLQTILPIKSSAGNTFAYAVALPDKEPVNGELYAAIGAPYQDDLGADSGAAYLYDIKTGKQTLSLTAQDLRAGDTFGYAVAISNKYAVVGAPYQDSTSADAGAVYVFDLKTGQQLRKLKADDIQAGDLFGYRVAIIGKEAVVSAPYQDSSSADAGAVYIFDLKTGDLKNKLTPSDSQAGALFGYSISTNVTADCDKYLLVSAPYKDGSEADTGSVYLFDINTGKQIEQIIADNLKAGDLFGRGLGLNSEYALIGASYKDFRGVNSGAAYLFDLEDLNNVEQIISDDLAAGDVLGFSIDMSQEYALMSAAYGDDKGVDSGKVYIIEFNRIKK